MSQYVSTFLKMQITLRAIILTVNKSFGQRRWYKTSERWWDGSITVQSKTLCLERRRAPRRPQQSQDWEACQAEEKAGGTPAGLLLERNCKRFFFKKSVNMQGYTSKGGAWECTQHMKGPGTPGNVWGEAVCGCEATIRTRPRISGAAGSSTFVHGFSSLW